MNIIIPVGKLTTDGGIERYTVEIIGQFLKFKEIKRIVVVCSEVDKKTVPNKIIKDINIIKTKSKPNTIRFLFESRRIINALKKALGKDTIVYTQHGSTIGGDVVVAQAVHLASILKLNKNIFTRAIRFAYPPHIKACLLEFYNFANAKRDIAISNLVKNELNSYWKIPEEKIRVVYSGVNTDEFKKNITTRKKVRRKLNLGNKFIMVFASNEFKRKNLRTIICAMAILKNYAIHLLVAGKDNPRKYVKMARKLNIADKITFLGLTKEIFLLQIFLFFQRYMNRLDLLHSRQCLLGCL